jgi:hypothetical protein
MPGYWQITRDVKFSMVTDPEFHLAMDHLGFLCKPFPNQVGSPEPFALLLVFDGPHKS